MLEVRNISSGYQGKDVCRGIDLNVNQGEIVALIAPNGAGKSTLLKTIFGLISASAGSIKFLGEDVSSLFPHERHDLGMALVLQGHRIFRGLTVRENLMLGGLDLEEREQLDRLEGALQLFPLLRDHLDQEAETLSGGEQQMVAFCRALIAWPRLLLLDEPSLGLAPGGSARILEKIKGLRSAGLAVLIVEQQVRRVLETSDRVYGLRLGKVAYCGRAEDLLKDKNMLRSLFL